MSHEEYWEHVEMIERVMPEAVLLPTLHKGHTRVNVIYLNSLLKKIWEQPSEDHPDTLEPVEMPQSPEADETLRGLWAERTRLFGEMNKLSNHFHDCTTDDQRADNSKAILRVWNRIVSVKANIAHYEQHHALPDPVEEGDQLPDNPVQLSRRLASLRSRISQKRRQIIEIAALDQGTEGKQSKIDACEQELKQLRHQAGLAEQKLKSYEQAEG